MYESIARRARHCSSAIAAIVLAVVVSLSPALAQSSNIVAVVNADPITRSSLSQACLDRYGSEVLDNMMNRYLILQECEKRGITITEKHVRDEIFRIANKFSLTVENYLKLLEEERDFAPGQYSREVIWPMLALRALVAEQVKVTDQEFNEAFIAQFGEAVKCRMIMINDRAKAIEIHQRVSTQPQAFGQLAKEYSEDETSASIGGLIPPIRKFNGDSRIYNAAFSLKDGQVSELLQLGDQWIMLQAVRRIPASAPSARAMPLVREQIQDRLRDEKMRGAASALFANLQKNAQVVKVIGDSELTKQHPGIAAIINNQKITNADIAAECVKRYGLDVLESLIDQRLLSQALRNAKKTVTQEDIDAEIAHAAITLGYVRSDGTADVTAWMESVMSDGRTTKEIYVADAVWPTAALKKLVASEINITQEDFNEGFESNYGPRVEVLAIVLSDQRTAQKVWEMARDNPSDQFFGQLAEQYSVEPVSASNLGKVPPIRKHGGQPAIEDEAFKMKAGDLSGIIATGDRYIVLRCQGYTKPLIKDAEAVKTELIEYIKEKKTNTAMIRHFDKLKGEADIDNFLDAEKKSTRVAGESAPRQ